MQAENLWSRARNVMPGGVNSPVRAFKSVGGEPLFIARGAGAYLFDIQGKRYVDYVCAWGPLILGHAHPAVVAAVQDCATRGLSFGAPTAAEVELAEIITSLMPSIEMIRMVNSGTEATMSAIRLARGYTGRNKIIKFDSCYHGHSDSLLVKAGSGLLTCGISSSAGVPSGTAAETLIAPYNDLQVVQHLFSKFGDDIAGIIVEPIAANNNLILPKPGFLQGLRATCDQYKSVLIFDEVITGFRVAPGGAQELYNIKADLTCLGKIIGGGLPVGAFGGKREIMELMAPLGPVYQAGTLAGNPLAMAAGLATLKELQKPGVYAQLKQTTHAVAALFQEFSIETQMACGVFGIKFAETAMFNKFFHSMLKNGVNLAPSAFEAGFVSTAHDQLALQATRMAIEESLETCVETQ